ncbi:MAG: hypothetical protein H6618_05025 [Deltaproteobacteria bacterium]|nr:hypothetical protein [Deltaproteobacteria bacterium]
MKHLLLIRNLPVDDQDERIFSHEFSDYVTRYDMSPIIQDGLDQGSVVSVTNLIRWKHISRNPPWPFFLRLSCGDKIGSNRGDKPTDGSPGCASIIALSYRISCTDKTHDGKKSCGTFNEALDDIKSFDYLSVSAKQDFFWIRIWYFVSSSQKNRSCHDPISEAVDNLFHNDSPIMKSFTI